MTKNWHFFPIKEVYKKTKSQKKGLKQKQAEKRLRENGKNILPQERSFSRIKLLFKQLSNPLAFILLSSALVSFFIDHKSDAIFILIVLFVNALVSFIQEFKAEKAISALKKMVTVRALVLRDGQKKIVDAENLTMGDILILKEGDKVPADCRIIQERNLTINEANLTGEWAGVGKKASVLSKNTPLHKRKNMAYAGTTIESGEAVVIIVAIGKKTELGKIISQLKTTKEEPTPLQKKINILSKWIGLAIIGLSIIVILLGLHSGENFRDIFIASLALAVSAIPEGLLPAITIILVIAMRRILKQKGLVKRLVAAEGLGSVSVICTDKTGTLTQGKMSINEIYTHQSGSLDNEKIGRLSQLKNNRVSFLTLKIGALTCNAFIENPDDNLKDWVIRGEPTDKAILLAAIQAGINPKKLNQIYPQREYMKFQSDLRFSASLNEEKNGKFLLFSIGAPEEIIKRSAFIESKEKEKLDKNITRELLFILELYAKKGLRIIACCYKEINKNTSKKISDEVQNMTFTGFLVLKDPLRKDTKQSINLIKRAGIRPIIITGDHKFTARAIAEELGIKTPLSSVIEGDQLEKLSVSELSNKVSTTNVFARILPNQKLKIVKALHRNDQTVAMFGDGVNDVLAIKTANVGVAVGSGSDAAKEASDIILLDNSFSTIVKAIKQGRLAYNNLQRVFVYLIADDFTEIMLFLVALIIGLPLPLLPAQILWINLVEDTLPNLALTMEKEGEKNLMENRPRKPDQSLIDKHIRSWSISVFIITGIFALLLFSIILKMTGDTGLARTVLFIFMATDSLLFAYSIRSFNRSIFRRDIFSNKWLNWGVVGSFVLLIAASNIPFFQKVLSVEPISPLSWLGIISLSFFEIILIDLFKKLAFKNKPS
jgi:Ca2+-transporting ATPase